MTNAKEFCTVWEQISKTDTTIYYEDSTDLYF